MSLAQAIKECVDELFNKVPSDLTEKEKFLRVYCQALIDYQEIMRNNN